MGDPVGPYDGEEIALSASMPPTITFDIDGRTVLTMHAGGRVEIAPDSDLDEASRLFWRCVVDLGWRHNIDVIFHTSDAS